MTGARHVVVLGAGPAGLAAAVAAASRAHVTLIDAADELGGQYWRHLPPSRPAEHEHRLHHGWSRYGDLVDRIGVSGVDVVTSAQVWSLERQGERCVLHALLGPADAADRERLVLRPDALVIATGAHDRTLPFPGWTLPGVSSAGAAQALAKAERVAVGARVVVAGAGPFLLPVAASVSGVGARVVGVFEAARVPALARGWSRGSWRPLAAKTPELVGYLRHLARYRIPYRFGHAVIGAHGDEGVEAVTVARITADWTVVPGSERRIAADAVAIGHGFTPRLEVAIAAGCGITPGGFVGVDDRQRTSVPGVWAAGEVTGIGGADAALAEGTIAGADAAGAEVDRRTLRRRDFDRDVAVRIDAAHGIRSGWTSWLADATIVCRCEEVTAGRLREIAAATGSTSLRSLKLTTRAGLGICQARVCGRTVEHLLGATGAGSDRRPIFAPVRLGELARTLDIRGDEAR